MSTPTQSPPQDARTAAGFAAPRIEQICNNIERVLQGKTDAIKFVLVALVANGHVLIEDVPGVGKTLLAKSVADSIGSTWRRIQFTSDLLPSDLLGVNVFDQNTGEFSFHPGAVFTNVLLADEVNRASPKTQSALLECMEERQITIDGRMYGLRDPFVVIATQNPLEHEGTYPLPESQLDRFLMRISMGYPAREASMEMLEKHVDDTDADLKPVVSLEDVIALQQISNGCFVADPLKEYVLDLGEATRYATDVQLGISPRGCIHLLRAAKAAATLSGRHYVIPDDIKQLAHPVFEHRLVLAPEAEIRGVTAGEVLAGVLDAVPLRARA